MSVYNVRLIMQFNQREMNEIFFSGIGYRHIQYALMLSATVLAYGSRTVLNVAIVAMTSDDPQGKDYPTYPEWKPKKNLILSSFFWGYICLQLGAGYVAKKYGPKRFLGGALLISSLFSAFIPLFGEQFDYIGVLICRFGQGLTQGFLLPSIHTLLSVWAPISERVKWGGLVYAGMALGNVIAMPLTGIICASKVGWPIIFYLYGGLGILWFALWVIFGSDSPEKHRSISEKEKSWIVCGIAKNEEETSKIPTPWKSIFTSVPVITLIITHMGQNWGFWTLLTEIPSFLQNILNLNIASNSYLSALPYLVMFILSFVMNPIADGLVERKIVSTTVSRKIFNTIGEYLGNV
ncbi:hypothetical protein JTB14_010573 [Gonioctena quinquepunctata]|nr:hypothetical protein JTB14_010573 [Gonioctena quinquepunctata]